MGGITKAIGNIAKTVSKVAGGIANIAGKALSFIQSPLKMLTDPLKKLAGGVLDKLPFGIGKMIKPFADKFIDSGASMLLGGPLGGLASLAKFAPTVKSIGDIATGVKGVADKVGALSSQPAQQNFQQLMAWGQAKLVH
ncbi:hypothetical protein JGU66_08785 [Myxococcaceae bacterium JPH2]|nr:hypothetical protein [Myxococcaceae bacterium JPH2]